MKPFLLFLTVAFISLSAKGQITFKKIIPSDQWKFGCSIIQTFDEGYAVCGLTPNDYTQPQLFGYFVKTDKYGDTLWTKKYLYGPHTYESVFKQTADSGFIICGTIQSLTHDDLYLIRTNSTGDTIWTKKFMGRTGYAIEVTPDQGYIIAGRFYDYCMILKIDSSGNEVWEKFFHPMGMTSSASFATAICNTNDNGYIVTGNCDNPPAYFDSRYIFLIKLDNMGDSIWGKIYQHVYLQQVFSIVQTDDNGYVLGGYLDSLGNYLNSHGYIIRTNDIGDTTWTYASTFNNGNQFRSVHKALSGGFIAGGGETSGYSGDILLEMISSTGELEWRKTFADTSYDGARSVRSTTDGGIILCSNIFTSTTWDYDIVIIKTDSNGVLTGLNNNFKKEPNRLSIFPNPCSFFTHLTFELLDNVLVEIDLLDNFGKVIKTVLRENVSAGKHQLLVDLNNLSEGIYYFRLNCKEGVTIQKIIVIR